MYADVRSVDPCLLGGRTLDRRRAGIFGGDFCTGEPSRSYSWCMAPLPRMVSYALARGGGGRRRTVVQAVCDRLVRQSLRVISAPLSILLYCTDRARASYPCTVQFLTR